MFEALGLTRRAESVYLAMLEAPEAGIGDLVQRLDLAESEVREALDELARMSLLQTVLGQPPRAVNPEVGLSALIARRQAEVAQWQHKIEESRVAFTTLLAQQAESKQAAAPELERVAGLRPSGRGSGIWRCHASGRRARSCRVARLPRPGWRRRGPPTPRLWAGVYGSERSIWTAYAMIRRPWSTPNG
ncbi:hypothetical protein [Sphaerisporangium perillae]|uniref:hypothetical protein n=1 Tax=Sphaerisporangium perillae TaxID=2935860 RepID=UPI00200E8ED0|nr:hypothetical protein [Sphaerisporangium perillae]